MTSVLCSDSSPLDPIISLLFLYSLGEAISEALPAMM